MRKMGDEMQRIIDGDTQDDRRYADDNDRNLVMEKSQSTHGKEPSPCHGECYQKEIVETAEREQEQGQYQGHRNNDCQDTIRLYLRGIGYSYNRGTDDMDVNILLPTGHYVSTCLQYIDKSGIILCLARSIRGIHHDNGFLHVGRKDIPIIHLMFETCI